MHELLNVLSEMRRNGALGRRSGLKDDAEALLRRFFPESLNSPVVAATLDIVFGNASLGEVSGSDLENVYLAHIEEIRNLALSSESSSAQRRIIETSEAEDCIVYAIERWDALKLINFLLLQSTPASEKSAIVATVRDEGLSILEWIAYHRALGFEEFFVYTNDNTDGSDRLLEILAANNLITLIHNRVSPKISPQQKCYEHSLYFLPQLRRCKWVSYLDIDEFLLPLKCKTPSLQKIHQEINALADPDAFSSIFFNWKWFGSGYKFEMEDGFVLERFCEARSDPHGKSFSRLSDIVSMRPVHYPSLLSHGQFFDSNFDPISEIATLQPSYGIGQINHYWNKSFEEFALKKIRGLPSQGLHGRQREFESFFAWDARAATPSVEKLPEDFVDIVREAYGKLIELEGMQEQLRIVQSNVKAKIDELHARFDLRSLFEKRGAV